MLTSTYSGNPGSGKTVLAGCAVSELNDIIPVEDAVIVFFFYSASHREALPGSKSSRLSAYRAILSQILHFSKTKTSSASEALMNAFTYAMRGSPQAVVSEGDIINLLHIALRLVPNLYIRHGWG